MLLKYKQHLRMAVQTTTNVYLILRKKWHFTMKASVDIFYQLLQKTRVQSFTKYHEETVRNKKKKKTITEFVFCEF